MVLVVVDDQLTLLDKRQNLFDMISEVLMNGLVSV